jgi:hypothetical protein
LLPISSEKESHSNTHIKVNSVFSKTPATTCSYFPHVFGTHRRYLTQFFEDVTCSKSHSLPPLSFWTRQRQHSISLSRGFRSKAGSLDSLLETRGAPNIIISFAFAFRTRNSRHKSMVPRFLEHRRRPQSTCKPCMMNFGQKIFL